MLRYFWPKPKPEPKPEKQIRLLPDGFSLMLIGAEHKSPYIEKLELVFPITAAGTAQGVVMYSPTGQILLRRVFKAIVPLMVIAGDEIRTDCGIECLTIAKKVRYDRSCETRDCFGRAITPHCSV